MVENAGMLNMSRIRWDNGRGRGRRGRPEPASRAKLTCENQDEIEMEANVKHAPLSPTERSDSIETQFMRLERSVEIIVRS